MRIALLALASMRAVSGASGLTATGHDKCMYLRWDLFLSCPELPPMMKAIGWPPKSRD